jgi:hypothetical protein
VQMKAGCSYSPSKRPRCRQQSARWEKRQVFQRRVCQKSILLLRHTLNIPSAVSHLQGGVALSHVLSGDPEELHHQCWVLVSCAPEDHLVRKQHAGNSCNSATCYSGFRCCAALCECTLAKLHGMAGAIESTEEPPL